jgi:pimeloyl-ACP methyl ester carboxylesterase
VASFVLIHGGGHGAWCWGPLMPYLAAPALALDLPGRGRHPADLESITCDVWADSAAADIEKAGLSDVILVGHSMAGLTLPRVVERIPERLARLVFVACTTPPEGGSILGELDPDVAEIAAAANAAGAEQFGLTDEQAMGMFCNGMDAVQTRFVLDNLCPEAPGPLSEPMRLAGLAQPVPRTYVKLLRDATLSQELQDAVIARLGDAEVRTLDACHDVMISHPRELAELLNGYL